MNMKNKNEILINMLMDAYNSHCDELQKVIECRLTTDGVDLFNGYLDEERERVSQHCDSKGLDLLEIIRTANTETQSNIGYRLIKKDIYDLIHRKEAEDYILKEYNLTPRKITNGIETESVWLKILGSPRNLQWFTKNTDKVLEACDKEDKWYQWTYDQIEAIKANWIKPNDILADVEDFQALVEKELPNGARDLLTFQSGN